MAEVFITGISGGFGQATALALLDLPFAKKPFRTVVDPTGVGPEIERCNAVLHDVTRTVTTNVGIQKMLALNT